VGTITARVRFAHPLLASVCYDAAPPWRRRAAHGLLAAVVADDEERARHLALAAERPDADVASALDGAVGGAIARGAPAAAAELSELAAELTPAEDGQLRRRRRLAAAEAPSPGGRSRPGRCHPRQRLRRIRDQGSEQTTPEEVSAA
jgi:hypothetical protein